MFILKEEERENHDDVLLYLSRDERGDIDLRANVRNAGPLGFYILTIENGRPFVELRANLPDSIGFPVDDRGRIIVTPVK